MEPIENITVSNINDYMLCLVFFLHYEGFCGANSREETEKAEEAIHGRRYDLLRVSSFYVHTRKFTPICKICILMYIN